MRLCMRNVHGDGLFEFAVLLNAVHEVAAVDKFHHEIYSILYADADARSQVLNNTNASALSVQHSNRTSFASTQLDCSNLVSSMSERTTKLTISVQESVSHVKSRGAAH